MWQFEERGSRIRGRIGTHLATTFWVKFVFTIWITYAYIHGKSWCNIFCLELGTRIVLKEKMA